MNHQKFLFLGILILSFTTKTTMAQHAKIYEEEMSFKTYPFSDPNPVPEMNRIYPYYYFNGYTSQSVEQKWKMVILENDYIRVFVCPDIGGKIWGAIEKSTGKEFLYFNHVVKFRDVAMRGAWTSGGLEYNFGDIGHIPTCATPVDYYTRKNDDGSVSCIVGATDLPSQTKWSVEIKVSPKKAFFETTAKWFNITPLPCSYYHWMNAAAKSSGNLEFLYPGNKHIGHGGEVGDWPNSNGKAINFYENNDFGFYKSYHVVNSYSNFFGGYWHNDDFGFGHWSNYDDKPGKKLWIWGLSQQGMIWKDLLTDNDGQYIEFQAGKLFNQAAHSSSFTPFKHKEFPPYDSDIMREIWFPLKATGGMVAASEHGVLNVSTKGDYLEIALQALQPIRETLYIEQANNIIKQIHISLNTLETTSLSILKPLGNYQIILGDQKLCYSSSKEDLLVDRPLTLSESFSWESSYGLFTKGLELEKQRRFKESHEYYQEALKKDPGYLPAMTRLALYYYRIMDYNQALSYAHKALSIDTYDGQANYVFGLVNCMLGNTTDAKSGFSIASASNQNRVASYIELSKLFLKERNYSQSVLYARKALNYDSFNPTAYLILAINYRKENKLTKALNFNNRLEELDPTMHFSRFERYLLSQSEESKRTFQLHIYNEMPIQSYLDLAIFYHQINLNDEALSLLDMAPENPIVNLWKAYIDIKNQSLHLSKALDLSPYLVFPHRNATAKILQQIMKNHKHWKLNYYLGLIYWNKGLITNAKQLFDECDNNSEKVSEDIPDFAPFYIAQSKLTNNTELQLKYLNKAQRLDPQDWRSALATTKLYLKTNQLGKAVKLSKEFQNKYPEQALLGINYAQALMACNDYTKALNFLKTYELLPFEGATIGRDIYHEACLRLSFNALEGGKYQKAIKWAEAAKLWPLNLGVGKPYEVDERLEDYITAYCYAQLGNNSKAKSLFTKVASYEHPEGIEENAKLYLQLLSLKEMNDEDVIESLGDKLQHLFPNNQYIKWAIAQIEGTSKAKNLRLEIQNSNQEIQPYDTKFVDKEFELLIDFVDVLNNNLKTQRN
ncbi:DUF5107 domain-containing protein [Puteibacter caeruleilacunae]|nr:DUF5107 domain-containing protein [Puteibacter caeruleilacunae]